MFYGFTKTHVSFEINTKRPLHNSDITIMNTCMASSFVVFISCLVNKILLKFYYSPHSYSQQQCHILKASLRTQNEWNSRLLSFSSPLVWPIKMIFKIFLRFLCIRLRAFCPRNLSLPDKPKNPFRENLNQKFDLKLERNRK